MDPVDTVLMMRRSSRIDFALGATLVAACVLFYAHVGVDWPAPAIRQGNGDIPDVIRDWLSVAAVLGEGSPTDLLSDLSVTHLGITTISNHPHPRTPGALLLQMPLLAIPVEWVWPVSIVAVAAGVGVTAASAARIGRWPWWSAPLIGPIIALSLPVMAAIVLGSQAPVVAALLAAAWMRVDRPDAGIWLGVAATLKMFPGLLIPMLWMHGRRRMAAVAGATVAALNLAGLALPDVSFEQISTLLFEIDGPHNLSFRLPLAAVALGALAMSVWARRLTFDQVMTGGCIAMLVLSPIVWDHYLIILLLPLSVLGQKVYDAWFRHVHPVEVARQEAAESYSG